MVANIFSSGLRAAILATYLALHGLFWRNLRGTNPSVSEKLRLSNAGKLTVLGVIGTVGGLLFCSAIGTPLGAPTCITAFGTTLAVTLCDREAPRAVYRGVAWSVLPLVAGLFVIVEAWTFLKAGVIVTPVALLFAGLALCFTSR